MKALLGGLPLLASADVSWTLREGTRPNMQTFDMMPADADTLATKIGPLKLETDRFTIEALYVIAALPGDNPHIKRVMVADRRVWWSYKLVRRYYNKQRNIGVKRITDPQSAPENLSVTPKVWYQRWTLKNQADGIDPASARWTVTQALEDVFVSINQKEIEVFGAGSILKGQNLSSFRAIDIENLIILENGDQAINRLLKYLPQAGIYIDYNGDTIVYSKSSGAEAGLVVSAGAGIVGKGDIRFVDNAPLRPREVHVLFQYEPEVRFDFDEAGSMTITADTRYSDNVLPTPDYSLVVSGQTYAQGTYITVDEAFAAWGVPPGFTSNISHAIVQRAMVPYMDLWAGVELSGALDPNADWASRIGSIQQNYRRTYRINRHWLDRILGLKAYRVATVNQVTGTRAPAIAYSDYCYIPGQRALFNERRNDISVKDLSYAINVKGHPAKYSEPASKNLNANAKGAPAHVTVADADQGIVHLDYMIDPYRLFEAILPSMMTQEDKEESVDDNGLPLISGPTADITQRGRPVCFDAIESSHLGSLPKLTRAHKMSLILTAMPGAPNDERALYRVKIKPADVKDLLPHNAKIDPAKGPIMEIYVGASTATARVPWLDARKTDIEAIFGIPNRDPSQPFVDQSDKIKDIVLNDVATGRGGASLRAISLATAARLYGSMVSRFEGEASFDMNGILRPAGWVNEVTHTLDRDGKAFTRFRTPDRLEPFDVFTFLDSSTRAMLLKLASPDTTE